MNLNKVEKIGFIGYFIGISLLFIIFVGLFRFTVNGYQIVTAHGTSMYPIIKDGDLVIINNNIPEGNLTGFILVFGRSRICHTCIHDGGEWLTFHGCNTSNNERATRDELKAVFIKVTDNSIFDMITLGLR